MTHTRAALRRFRRSHRYTPRALVAMFALLGAAVAPARSAFAQAADAKAVARAKALEGTRIADQGQHQPALDLFREAYALYAEPAYLFDIGVECQALGRDVEALDAYRRFLRDPRNTPRSLITQATELLTELEKRLGEIQLRGAPSGAAIDVDDEPRGNAPLGEPLRAKPGIHRVGVRQAGFEPFRVDVRVPEGAPVAVDVPMLAPTPAAEAAPIDRRPWLSWAFSLGLGFWTAGPRTEVGPSPAFTLGAGHALATLPGDVAFELGAKLGFTYLNEPAGTSTFLSVLMNPRAIKPLGTRVRAFVDVGVGLLVLSGLSSDSSLLQRNRGVTGPLSAFELRPGAGVTYDFTEAVSIYIAPTFIWNPSPSERFVHPSVTRLQIGLGLMGEL